VLDVLYWLSMFPTRNSVEEDLPEFRGIQHTGGTPLTDASQNNSVLQRRTNTCSVGTLPAVTDAPG
jgi:hypothetical protein